MGKVMNAVFKGVNIGFDFGTTYSLASFIERLANGLDLKMLSEKQIDSVVVKTPAGEYECGVEARESISDGEADVVYKGFKMMLAETAEDVLKARKYDTKVTPEAVTSMFIKKVLEQSIGRIDNCDAIDNLVIGVPEIWFKDSTTFDNRARLINIVDKLTNVKGEKLVRNVQLVSEPSCACAYYIFKHKEKTGKDFIGNILLVDYGGGTLDIALCDVKANGSTSELAVLERVGTGKNPDEFIGNAGMAYIEAITKRAIAEQGIEINSAEQNGGTMYQKINFVETKLKNSALEIQKTFEDTGRRNMGHLKEKVLCKFTYNGKQCVVTYFTLYQVYSEIIEKVFEEKLGEIKKKLDNRKIDYSSKEADDFRIVCVGGFGGFDCVQRQIKKSFDVHTGDKRFNNEIFSDRSECEKAVSYGAALIADGVISFKLVAPYHIGFGSEHFPECMSRTKRDEEIAAQIMSAARYAITKGDIITPDDVSFVGGNKNPAKFYHEKNNINIMLYNTEDDPYKREDISWGYILEAYKDKIKLEPNKYYNIGFSLDNSLIVTLHLRPLKRIANRVYEPEEYKPIRLDNITSIIGTQEKGWLI